MSHVEPFWGSISIRPNPPLITHGSVGSTIVVSRTYRLTPGAPCGGADVVPGITGTAGYSGGSINCCSHSTRGKVVVNLNFVQPGGWPLTLKLYTDRGEDACRMTPRLRCD